MLFSADDDLYPPTPRLLDLSLKSIELARHVDVAALTARIQDGPRYPEVWPGEHYKLLAGLMLALRPERVVEIGTATGLSALAIKQFLAPTAQLTTFDIIPWTRYPGAVLVDEDFWDGRLMQRIDDLQEPTVVEKYRSLLESADFIFIDAAKDGVMEQRFIDNLLPLSYNSSPIVMFDDIRLLNMLGIWRRLPRPRLDLTSFGHWSGTGLVDWTPART